MEQINEKSAPPPHLIWSLTAVILGSLVLRAAASVMGENIQFYFNAISEAAGDPNHPLRAIVGPENVYVISDTVGNIILGTFYIAEVLGAMVLGVWSDKFGRKLFIILGPVFGGVAVLITSITTAVWLLIFTRLLEGLSTGSNAPATLGYIAETTSKSPGLRMRISGFFEVAMIGGIAIGFVLGGWMWEHTGAATIIAGIPFTSPAFAWNAIIYLISFIILWVGINEVREKKHRVSMAELFSPIETIKHYWTLSRNPLIAGFAPAWIAINAVLGILINTTARIFTDKSDVSGQLLVGNFTAIEAGNIRAAYALCFILGIIIWTVAFSNVKRINTMLIGSVSLIISCILIVLINHQTSLQAPFTIFLAVLLVISIMVQSGFTPAALAYLADISETQPEDRGAIMGLYSVFFGIGQAFGLYISGPFIDFGGADGMAAIVAVLGLFAGILVLRLRNVKLPSSSGAQH